MKRIAIMQPYLFPYLGYYQLVQASDEFVFYDDVNFIKKGWINRNNLLVNGSATRFTVALVNMSQNRRINDVKIDPNFRFDSLLKTITLSYKKAPFFNETYSLIEKVFSVEKLNIAELAQASITVISEYLGLPTRFYVASASFGDTDTLDRADRLISITKRLNGSDYVNAIGGQTLYTKEYFAMNNVRLHFLETLQYSYIQFGKDFVPHLSMIDVLMFNSIEGTHRLLNTYRFV